MNLKISSNKKAIIGALIIISLISLFLMKPITKSQKNLEDIESHKNMIENNNFALMLEQDDGAYQESTSNSWPTDMVFNSELSGCIDIDGNKMSNVLSYDKNNNAVEIIVDETSYCYVYFDKDLSLYSKVVNDNNSYLLSGSDKGNRQYNTYYYAAGAIYNNVLYGGYCWKMVITTEGNGVKIIYDGLAQIQNNGTFICNNFGTNSQLPETKEYNSISDSPAYAGYMYNKVYRTNSKEMTNISDNYKYGNSFIYNNGTYTLTNTKEFSNWRYNYDTLSNNHYTCYNSTGKCAELYYIFNTTGYTAYYITLTNGKSITDALNEMLYDDNVNVKNSTIKDYIDLWYEENLLNKTDNEGNLYSSYLQNTIYCNNRETSNIGGWNPNGGNTESTNIIFNYNSLDCSNKIDQFTLKVEKGGTAGYGNNALDYPIALLTSKEAELTSGYSYINSGSAYWLLNNEYFGPENIYGKFIYSNGGIGGGFANNNNFGVRPVVTLSSSVETTIGDGSSTNPYQIKLK